MLVRMLLAIFVLAQQISIPASAIAHTTPATSTSLPSSPMRGADETLDGYLQRMAATQPQRFQQAALTAVQDAFNGRMPEVEGDHAMEAQIAKYLQGPLGPTKPGAGTTLSDDGSVTWQASALDSAGLSGSDWQMIARPRVNPQAFAEQFDKLVAQETGNAKDPLAHQTVNAAPPEVQPVMPMLGDASLSAVSRKGNALPVANAPVLASSVPPALQPAHNPSPSSSDGAQTVTADAPPEAELSIAMAAPTTANFGDVITYTFAVTNTGPAAASAVQFTQTLPANGVYTETIPACVANANWVVCTVGALPANDSRTVNVLVQMNGADTVTSTVDLADNGGSVDPGLQPNSALVTTTVSSTTRGQREIGNVVIEANEFVTGTETIDAKGAIRIGHKKPDNSIVFHLGLSGAEDSLSWVDGQTAITGTGVLAHMPRDYRLISGTFTIDASQTEPTITPSESVVPSLFDIDGFSVVGAGTSVTDIAVVSGTATISAGIKIDIPGLISEERSVAGTMHPDGNISASVGDFTLTLAKVEFDVKSAVLGTGGISANSVKVTLPEKYGKASGTVDKLRLTPKNIDFGGVGVKVPLPDLYPFGKPVTSTGGVSNTTTTTPTIVFINNKGTINYTKGKVGIALESTLQLTLPSNKRNIPIEVRMTPDGEFSGKIKELRLDISGQDLEMKNIEASSAGLKVAEASLTVQGSADKPKKPDTGSGGAGLAKVDLASINAPSADKPKDKKPDKKLTAIVKNIVIDKDGIKIGGIGGTGYLPDIKLGSSALFTKIESTVVVNEPTGDASFETSLKGVLKILLKNNKQDIPFTGKRDKDGKFSGTLTQMSLTVAQAKLQLTNIKFDDKSISAKDATLTLPGKLKGAQATVKDVKIDENGLSFGDASVKIPIEFTIGNKDEAGNKLSVKGTLMLTLSKDKDYGFEIEGKVTLVVAKQTAEAEGKIGIDGDGNITGSLESFKLVVADMELGIKSAKIKEGTFEAAEATLSVPKAWGGLTATVYQVRVNKDELSIGGGSFKLPEIKIGDMVMSLEGKLKKEGDGYIIAAGGLLKMPNLDAAGCSGIGIAAEIYTGSSQTVAMRIQPMTADNVNGFSLRELKLSVACNIKLGASGFVLTKVEGTLVLDSNVTRIQIKTTIESVAKVGPVNALTGDGDMTIEYVRNPKKFEIGLGASMKLFGLFEAAQAKASMRFTDGEVPFLFKAEMNIDAVIAKGEIKLNAWTKNGEFFLTGRVYGQVGVRKGAIAESCWTIKVPDGISWRGISFRDVRICASIPPSDLFINATMEFGKFQQGDGSQWGLKAGVNLLGKNYGVFINSSGGFSVGNTDQYRLVDAPTLQRALRLQQQLASGFRTRATLSAVEADLVNAYRFEAQQVTINAANLTQPGDLGVTILLAEPDSDVQIGLKRPDGIIFTGSNAPSNVTFRQEALPAGQATDPVTGQPTAVPPMRQMAMNVTGAEMGQWQLVLSRQPTYAFIINVDGTKAGPPLAKLHMTNLSHASNTVDLSWTQSAISPTKVTVYASQGQITTTVSAPTATVGGVQAKPEIVGTATQFGGKPVMQFAIGAGPQVLTKTVDLTFLQSGTYNVWIEVDDGMNTPARQYFPGTVAVEHDWQDTWQAGTLVTPTLGGLIVSWNGNTHPDVDGYELRLNAPSSDAFDEDEIYVDAGDTLSQTVTGLSANTAYSVTVVAYDSGTGDESESVTVVGTPLRAPFSATVAPTALNMAGGQSTQANVTVASTVDPYPGQVFLSLDAVPAGLDAAFVSDIVRPTVAGVQAGLVITADATLPNGVYTVSVLAASNGDTHRLDLPLTVRARDFTLQANPVLTVQRKGSNSLVITTGASNGETDPIAFELLDAPDGIEWSIMPISVTPGTAATLVVSSTDYAVPGVYDLTIRGTDGDHEHTVPLTLTVVGFEVTTPWDSYATVADKAVTYSLQITGEAWVDPIALSVDPSSLAGRFTATVSSASVNISAMPTVRVMPYGGTPPGIYEIAMQAQSGTYSQSLPLYVTVQSDSLAIDLQAIYAEGEGQHVIAGELYTYTLKARNISANNANNVILTDTTAVTTYISPVSSTGCTPQVGVGVLLRCNVGVISATTESDGAELVWQAAANAPDGAVVLHTAEVASESGVTETSRIDNEDEHEVTILRLSDLSVSAEADSVNAGETFVVRATVRNDGPSYDDGITVTVALPADASYVSGEPSCVSDVEQVACPIGTLANGAQAMITLTLRSDQAAMGTLETVVDVIGSSDDQDLTNNTATAVTTLTEAPELQAQLTTTHTGPVLEGETVDYTIILKNIGPSQAQHVALEVTPPPQGDLVSLLIGDVLADLGDLTLNAGEVMTFTASLRYTDDSAADNVALAVGVPGQTPLAQLNFAIDNVAPTAVFSDSLSVNEGEWGVLRMYATDVALHNDPLTITWDLDNDGQFDDGNEGVALFDARAIDGPTTRQIAVRVQDDDGGERIITGTVNILNVAPNVDIGIDQMHPYTQPFVIDVDAQDFGPGDVSAPTITVTWGDGSQQVANRLNSPLLGLTQLSHVYNAVGNYATEVCVNDGEGGIQCDQATMQAACLVHGATIRISYTATQVTLNVENSSGNATLPAGMKITAYAGATALKTFTLDQPLAVGQSRALSFVYAVPTDGVLINAVLDDDGTGKKSTQYCSGSVSQTIVAYRYLMPIVKR